MARDVRLHVPDFLKDGTRGNTVAMGRLSHSLKGAFHPTSYRAPHSGQMRIARYISRVDLMGTEAFPALLLKNDVWNPSW